MGGGASLSGSLPGLFCLSFRAAAKRTPTVNSEYEGIVRPLLRARTPSASSRMHASTVSIPTVWIDPTVRIVLSVRFGAAHGALLAAGPSEAAIGSAKSWSRAKSKAARCAGLNVEGSGAETADGAARATLGDPAAPLWSAALSGRVALCVATGTAAADARANARARPCPEQ